MFFKKVREKDVINNLPLVNQLIEGQVAINKINKIKGIVNESYTNAESNFAVKDPDTKTYEWEYPYEALGNSSDTIRRLAEIIDWDETDVQYSVRLGRQKAERMRAKKNGE